MPQSPNSSATDRIAPDDVQALIDAVWHADLDQTRKFLGSLNADAVNTHVYRQNTILFFACRVPGYAGQGERIPPVDANEITRVQVIDLLVAHGADVNARNQRKVTPLHMAARYGLARVVDTLLRHGADVDARDVNQETPLYRAANLGRLEVAEVLLKHGAVPNQPNRRGQTPLHRAIRKGNSAIARTLRAHDPSLEEKESTSDEMKGSMGLPGK